MINIRRRKFMTLLGGMSAASPLWPLTLRAQEAQKRYRVAYFALAGDQDAVIVTHRLEELGYVEGKNLFFDFRSAEGEPAHLPLPYPTTASLR